MTVGGLEQILVGIAEFAAGMVAMAGILARYVVREDRREQHAEDVRESLLAADWRPVDPESNAMTCTTVRLPVIPVQRVAEAVAA